MTGPDTEIAGDFLFGIMGIATAVGILLYGFNKSFVVTALIFAGTNGAMLLVYRDLFKTQKGNNHTAKIIFWLGILGIITFVLMMADLLTQNLPSWVYTLIAIDLLINSSIIMAIMMMRLMQFQQEAAETS